MHCNRTDVLFLILITDFFPINNSSYVIVRDGKTFLTLILFATSSLCLTGWIEVIQSLGLLSPDLLSIRLKYVYIECIIFFGRITKWIKHMQYLSLSKLTYTLLIYSAHHKCKGVLHYFMHMDCFKHLWNAATSVINLLLY